MTVIILIIVGLAVLHLLGGARTHRRHYRRHGAHPNLYYLTWLTIMVAFRSYRADLLVRGSC